MKGLILKDIYAVVHNLKKIILFLLTVTLTYVIILLTTKDNDALSAFILTVIPIFTGIFMSVSAFSHDEKSEWMKQALISPASRRQYLLSKYISHLIFCSFGLIVGILLILLASAITGTMGMSQSIAIGGAALIGIVLFSTLIVPIMIRFGTLKGAIICTVVCLTLIILATVYVLLLFYLLLGSNAIPAFVFVLIPIVFLITAITIHSLGFRWIQAKEL